MEQADLKCSSAAMALYYFDARDNDRLFPGDEGRGLLEVSLLLVQRLSRPWRTM